MENIFKILSQAESAIGTIHDIQGRNISLALGKIVNTDDPYGWGRVQVTLAVHGGKSISPWYHRMVPLDNCYPPAFLLGRTAVCGYADGDSNTGVIMGVLVNAVNTLQQPAPTQFNYFIGATGEGLQVTLDPTGAAQVNIASGASQIAMTHDNITMTVGSTTLLVTSSSVKINGKDVATIGAKDTRNDTLVTKGY